MGAINKIDKRKKIKVLEQTPLKGWTDSDGDAIDLSDLEFDDYLEFEYHENKESFAIGFETTVLPHCCGIFEVGNLEISSKFPLKQFEELFSNLLNNHKGYTYMINTNGKDASKTFETLLSKTNLFTPVKRFKNANSGNIITIWISNGMAL